MRETQRVAILTTLFVGFRVGEVLALKISDLDLEKQTLSVTKNLIRIRVKALDEVFYGNIDHGDSSLCFSLEGCPV